MEIKKNIFIGALGAIAGCLLTSALFLQIFSTTEKTVPSVLAEIAKDPDMVTYNYVIVDNDDGISYNGMTAVLKDSTRLNVYFKLENGATIQSYTDFAVDGLPVTPSLASDGSYYVTIYDISAKELGNPHVITVGGLTIGNISAITYVYRVSLQESPTEKTLALTKALYDYYKAAETYFCDEHDYESEIVVETSGSKAGVMKYTCKNCGGKYWDAIHYSYGLAFALNTNGTEYAVTGYTGEIKDIVLPDKYNGLPVTEIDASAFENSNLTSVILPNGIKKIGTKAFSGCENLAYVYYIGTAQERSEISVGDGNETFTSGFYFYNQNEPTEAGNFWYYLNESPTLWPTHIKITQKFKINYWDSQTYTFIPTKSGNYTVSFDNEQINIVITHNNIPTENRTGTLSATAGEEYFIELVNKTGEDVTGFLTIEFVD